MFTGGIGENSSAVRTRVVSGMEELGIHIDEGKNDAESRDARRIYVDDSRVPLWVIPSSEELYIARSGARDDVNLDGSQFHALLVTRGS